MRWRTQANQRRSSVCALVAIMALTAAAIVTVHVPAANAVGTCGAGSNPHNGFFKNSDRGMVRGARATLKVRTSAACTSNGGGSFTTLYNMVYSPLGKGWSQVGYYKSVASGITQDWSQTHRDDNDTIHNTFGGHVTDGLNYVYEVYYVPNGCYSHGGCFYNVINSNIISDTAFDPTSAWGSGNWNMEYSEESLFYGSNVPGVGSSQALVGSMAYYSDSYTWLTVDCGADGIIKYIDDDADHWAHSYVSCANQTLYTFDPY